MNFMSTSNRICDLLTLVKFNIFIRLWRSSLLQHFEDNTMKFPHTSHMNVVANKFTDYVGEEKWRTSDKNLTLGTVLKR
jgi:hypothetical protein